MEFENIEHRKGLPYKLFLVSIGHRSHHFHSDLEVIFVIQGKIQVQIGQTSYEIHQNEFCLINPYEIHSITDLSQDQNILLIIQLTTSAIALKQNFMSKLKFHTIKIEKRQLELRNLMYKMYVESFNEQIYSDYLLNAYILEFAALLLKHLPYEVLETSSQSTRTDAFKRLKYVIDYVEAHFDEKNSLDQLANDLHISKYHLSQFIKQHMGISFQEYLNAVRLTHAITRLLSTDMSILDIALESGFSDQKYLNALVRKRYGFTAKTLRRESHKLVFSIPSAPVGSIHLPFDQAQVLKKISATLS